ncbi:MAG: biosynthetic peptidoglycan transglycosylase [Bacteroidia bacterium]|jgi:hypothetical protein
MQFNRQSLKRYLKTLAYFAGVFLLLMILVFLFFRNALLHKAIDRVSQKIEQRFQVEMRVQQASFTGISGIAMHGISLVPQERDTLLVIDTLELEVRLWYALLGDIRIGKVKLHRGYLQLTKRNAKHNFDFLLADSVASGDSSALTKPANAVSLGKRGFAATVYKLIDALLDHVPADMEIASFSLNIQDESIHSSITLAQLRQTNDRIHAEMLISDSLHPGQHWQISGFANPSTKKADLYFYNLEKGQVIIPYLDQKLHLLTGFDTLHMELNEIKMQGGILHITGQSGISNFMINHPKIAHQDVVVEKAGFRFHFILGEKFISLDSSTSVTFNRVQFNPYAKLNIERDTVLSFSVHIPELQAQDFIESLPNGLFTHFKGMEISGRFAYRLDFVFNENHPQDLVFESHLKKQNLQIRKYGEANLAKLNGDFVYTPIDRGKRQRSFVVGIANHCYTPLDQISPFLQKCVLTTEDPSFFFHRGFIDEAFRQSIVKNIRKRKFARGASTISMQLVKNVFLTREKTISRKLEEILLVYMLENNRISTKERMLEVYFNVIEWGPNVYGIGEASVFYFNKHPKDLTLNECLFLASIIPRPKGFMWRFDQAGMLKPFASKQLHYLTDLMLRRLLIEPKDTLQAASPIVITGPARDFIRITPDTLEEGADFSDDKNLIQTTHE